MVDLKQACAHQNYSQHVVARLPYYLEMELLQFTQDTLINNKSRGLKLTLTFPASFLQERLQLARASEIVE